VFSSIAIDCNSSRYAVMVYYAGAYQEQGKEVLSRFVSDLEDVARLDQEPKLEGKRMFIFLSPLPKKK